jgi:hypothetical protein
MGQVRLWSRADRVEYLCPLTNSKTSKAGTKTLVVASRFPVCKRALNNVVVSNVGGAIARYEVKGPFRTALQLSVQRAIVRAS